MAELIYLLREDWYKPGTAVHLSAWGVHVGYWLAAVAVVRLRRLFT